MERVVRGMGRRNGTSGERKKVLLVEHLLGLGGRMG